MKCLNHMVTDAMRHAPKALEYMSQVEDPQVFAFCAIPQVMAIATLSLCYDNGKVFEGVVKMRRGQTAVVCNLSARYPVERLLFLFCQSCRALKDRKFGALCAAYVICILLLRCRMVQGTSSGLFSCTIMQFHTT